MPLNYFPTGKQPGWRECHVVNPDNPPRTTVLTGASIAAMGGRESVQVKQWVNGALGLFHLRQRGTVHLWQYSNGDVRYTFQPAIRPSAAFGLAA